MVDVVERVRVRQEVIVLREKVVTLGQLFGDLREGAKLKEVQEVGLREQRHVRRRSGGELDRQVVDQVGGRFQLDKDVRPLLGEARQAPLHGGATRASRMVGHKPDLPVERGRRRLRCHHSDFGLDRHHLNRDDLLYDPVNRNFHDLLHDPIYGHLDNLLDDSVDRNFHDLLDDPVNRDFDNLLDDSLDRDFHHLLDRLRHDSFNDLRLTAGCQHQCARPKTQGAGETKRGSARYASFGVHVLVPPEVSREAAAGHWRHHPWIHRLVHVRLRRTVARQEFNAPGLTSRKRLGR